ncbi:MAG TPA: beta-galactosidase [Lachnospiraceae bacterium]|nr:beta-galactosidase [Lachnospiraceae bacterium]
MEKMYYGGDYNPEQWTPDIWEEDMRMFKLAGIDILTLNVFSWALLQPSEEEYDFSLLDRIVKLVTDSGMKICMATSTAAHPAWMAKRHPDICRVEWNGMKRKFGGRHNSCPNSPTFQKYSVRLAEKLAERYRDQKNIVAWHVSNEYSGKCYCENCEKAFRIWLQRKYGTLEKLNYEWNTAFWGHTFYDWDEIVAPSGLTEEFDQQCQYQERTTFQGISLDYMRFCSDSLIENYIAEYKAIRKHIPDAKITTNLMGTYKGMDYQKLGKYLDFASYDNYPASTETPAFIGMKHDLMRGLKQGQPFWLMEQTPSVSNWLQNNSLKRPGVLRLWSYQAVAHGADAVMYFQMRRSTGACEKYHGAVIDHVGNENTRVFREVSALGRELQQLGDEILGSYLPKETAVIFDWDNWWATEYSAGPSTSLKYVDEIYRYYEALHGEHIPVDLISCEDRLEDYKIVFAPLHYMVKPGVADRIKKYVEAGGRFVTTFFSGYVNENDHVTVGGYPGELRELLGIWVEEIDALPDERENHFSYNGVRYPAKLLCDLLHPEGANVRSSYEEDFYEGMPVLTENSYGKGTAYYIATSSNEAFYHTYLKELCGEAGVIPLISSGTKQLEVTLREKPGVNYYFFLNHSPQEIVFPAPAAGVDLLTEQGVKAEEAITLTGYGVMILKAAAQK